MNFISNIAYKRENVSDEYAWKKVGRLYIDDDRRCKIALYAFHQGLCIATPTDETFLRGEIVYPVEAKDGEVQFAFVGYIATTENERGKTIYAIRFEAFPLARPIYGNSLWLQVNLDDAEGHTPHHERSCPF